MRKARDPNLFRGRDAKGRERMLGADGYIHVKVGVEHPMGHVNGWAREHRVMMSEHLGRPLLPTEEVHHLGEDKTDNRIENFELKSKSRHTAEHKHRLGTGKATCRNGHPWSINAAGRKRCRTCENAADRSRYNVNKK